MINIEIDFDVYKALTMLRTSEEVSCNDVLRELLKLDKIKTPNPPDQPKGWNIKGKVFPDGTKFRAKYKTKMYYGIVEDGALVVENNRYNFPSAAANAITNTMVNGWIFWECQMPGTSQWKKLKVYRKKNKS